MKMKTKLLIIALISILAISFLSLTSHVLAAGLPETQDGIITLTEDVTLESDVTGVIVVPADKTITLNLNGHTITAESGKVAITNNGTLTIKGEGNIIANGNYAVSNHGTLLTIDGGNYSKTTPSATQSLISNGWYTNTDNTSGELSNMIINGGSFDGGSYTTIKNDAYGALTINGGTFTSTQSSAGIQEAGKLLTINGGTFDAVVALTPACSVLGEEKSVSINGGIFNKAVQTYNVSGTKVYASTMHVSFSNEATYNNNLSLSQKTKNTTIDMDHNISGLTVKGTLTLGGYILSDTLPEGYNLNNINAGGIILSSIDKDKTSTISNSTITNKIMAGNVILTNVTTKEFSNNSKDGTVTIEEGTNITKINYTSNPGSAIVVNGGTVGQIVNTGSTKTLGFDLITINNGSVGQIQTSKGDIVVNGGTVEAITIVDKYLTTNPVSVNVKEGAIIGKIDNQRANDESATVETTITIPENNIIGEDGKVLTKISIATISDIEKLYSYTEKGITLNPTIKIDNKTLVKDTDYTLTYENNVEVGTGKVIITGIGDYTGTVSKTFIIVPKETVISVKSQTKTSINLSWEKSVGTTGYEVYMSTSKNGKYSKVTTVTGTSYNKKSLSVAKTYYFKVRPYATIDGKKQYGEYSKVFAAATVPNKTTLKSLTTGVEKVTLKWTKVSGANGYVIYMATSKNGKYSKVATVNSGKTVKYTKNGLMPNRKHYFKVKAIIKTNDNTAYSSFSNSKSVRTKNLYIIKRGDTLTALSKKFKTTINKLVKLNNIKNKNLIRTGKKIRIA